MKVGLPIPSPRLPTRLINIERSSVLAREMHFLYLRIGNNFIIVMLNTHYGFFIIHIFMKQINTLNFVLNDNGCTHSENC